MSGGARQGPAGGAALRLEGFRVRVARPDERAGLMAFFPNDPLGSADVLCVGAFGHPGEVPVGAAIVRPSRRPDGNVGHFLVYVRPECRRRKVGQALVRHLYSLALANGADKLIYPELVHQDRADNAFYRSCGMTPERSFATYSVELGPVLAFCEPLVERFCASEPEFADVRVQSLSALDPADVADYFHAHFSGFADTYLAGLRGGGYDLELSSAATKGGRIVCAGLGRTQAGVTSVMMDLIVAAPEWRSGPVSLSIIAYSARLALGRGLTQCVFEADPGVDPFATGFARRMKAKAQWSRYLYAIGREGMRRGADAGSGSPMQGR